jgi:UDP-N-acetylmuramate-alanine ligase
MDGLQEAGAHLHIGHSVSNLKGITGSRLPDAMVVSSAIPQDNVEILHANAAGVPV